MFARAAGTLKLWLALAVALGDREPPRGRYSRGRALTWPLGEPPALGAQAGARRGVPGAGVPGVLPRVLCNVEPVAAGRGREGRTRRQAGTWRSKKKECQAWRRHSTAGAAEGFGGAGRRGAARAGAKHTSQRAGGRQAGAYRSKRKSFPIRDSLRIDFISMVTRYICRPLSNPG